MTTTDRHGNRIAQEGVTRCACGSKYWEADRCVDCGEAPQVPIVFCNADTASIHVMPSPMDLPPGWYVVNAGNTGATDEFWQGPYDTLDEAQAMFDFDGQYPDEFIVEV